ncbi:unnamed protein product [Heterobilharzia americana]|nr:unnamed protein product [Heterobilharzia americana]
MTCLRVWTIIISIVVIIVKHNESMHSRNVASNGGYIGCLYQAVCLRDEICFDDSLFGRCARGDAGEEILAAGPYQKLILNSLFPTYRPEKVDWSDETLQCLLRTALLISKTHSNFVDPRSFCLSQYDENNAEDSTSRQNVRRPIYNRYENDGKMEEELVQLLPSLLISSVSSVKNNAVDDQFKSKYVKREIRTNRAFPSYMFSNPLKTSNPHYLDEDLPQHRYNDYKYNKLGNIGSNDVAVTTELNNENQLDDFNRRIQQMIRLSENFVRKSNYDGVKFDGEQTLRENTADTSQKGDHDNIEPRLHQDYSLLSDNVVEKPLEGGSPLEPRMQPQQEEVEAPRKSVTRLRAQKLMSGPHKHLEHRWIWIKFLDGPISNQKAQSILSRMSDDLKLTSPISFFFAGVTADSIVDAFNTKINSIDGNTIEDVGFGRGASMDTAARIGASAASIARLPGGSADGTATEFSGRERWEKYTMTIVLCSSILGVMVILTTIYLIQVCYRKRQIKSESNQSLSSPHSDDSTHPLNKKFGRNNQLSESQNSSVSSWSSEPIQCSIDVPTGHLILSYMEQHLRDRGRLTSDWNAIDKYVSEEGVLYKEGENPENQLRNRVGAPIPYEQSRVKLRSGDNDYINASLLYDNNPRNPVYIATMTPTIKSIPDFWSMVWEQGCVIIVCLERNDELKRMDEVDQMEPNDAAVKYWPNEGTHIYGSFEVHLVSEHSWSDNYIVRSFYLKRLATNETRTVTQFHYLTWKDENVKENSKPVLEFRRKVNRSFRGMMSPIVVHCCDGCGRTGAYILLDLALNRIVKGIKEIDIAASLEHLRDQRPNMIKTLEQYEFVLSATAEEVDAMLQTNT